MIVKSQDAHYSIPRFRIIRTTIERKIRTGKDGQKLPGSDHWLITATVEQDRAVTLARYPTEQEAIAADTMMWLCEEEVYYFPVPIAAL